MKTGVWVSGLAVGIVGTSAAFAQPAIWETNFGAELAGLTSEDDAVEMVSLSFGFAFDGGSFTELHVGTNGGIGIGGVGEADEYPSGDEFINTDSPMMAPFWSDLDLQAMGTVHFNDFGNRAVITWNGVGSFENETAPNTFQVQVFDSGKIVFGYDGIQANTADFFDETIHVGLTQGNLSDFPVDVDYSSSPFHSPSTVLERFEQDVDALDLDQTNIIFTPDGTGGYRVTVPAPGAAVVLGLGAIAMGRRRMSR